MVTLLFICQVSLINSRVQLINSKLVASVQSLYSVNIVAFLIDKCLIFLKQNALSCTKGLVGGFYRSNTVVNELQ